MSQIEEVELGIEQARKLIATAESLKKLFNNEDFKAVVTNGYLKDEAVRLVMYKAEPSVMSSEHKTVVEGCIDAIGHFNQYLVTVQALGSMAQRSLVEYEELQAELLVEGE